MADASGLKSGPKFRLFWSHMAPARLNRTSARELHFVACAAR